MGMTSIELDVARSTIRKNNAVASKLEKIDWEQRRYEIAKEMLPQSAIGVNSCQKDWMDGMSYQKASAVLAVKYADALIEELKKGVENGNI